MRSSPVFATSARLDDDATAHVLGDTFDTTLVRDGIDLVIIAELLGHARLETRRHTPRSVGGMESASTTVGTRDHVDERHGPLPAGPRFARPPTL